MLRTRFRGGVLVICTLLITLGAYASTRLAAQNAAPVLTTDKTGYLLGESVAISVSGLAAAESVTVQVAKSSGEAYEPIAAQADADGNVNVSWTLNDADARRLSVSATGADSGEANTVAINRVALISTDKYDYRIGEVVHISGAGFDPAESVTVEVQHSNDSQEGTGHLPFPAAADDAGNLAAEWLVGEDADGSIFRITATGVTSGLVATATITDPPITFVDTGGVDDVAGAQDLNFYQFENFGTYIGGTPAVALTWGLDDTAFGAGVEACAQVDTDRDGASNRMICVTVNGNPPGVASTSLYSCADTGLGCASPTLVGAFAGTVTASTAPADPFGGAHACTGSNCAALDTVVNVTLRNPDLGLPAGERPNVLVWNVCTASDCGIPPGSGLLEVSKQIPPQGQVGTLYPFTFNFGAGQTAADGQSSFTLTPDLAFGTVIRYLPMAPGTYSLYEQIPAGWQLTDTTCRQQNEILPTLPVQGPATAGVQNFLVLSGQVSRCKFVNAPGVPPAPAIDLIKFVNGDDANAPTGPVVAVGSTVTFTFQVTNTGNVTLAPVVVTDDVLGSICTIPSLAAGASQTCTATATATAGQHVNTGTAVGTPPTGGNVTDSDLGHYVGSSPAIDLIKFVNGDDANSPTGPVVGIGSTVTFTFQVTNTGNVTLAPVVVTDNVLGSICTIASLAPGASQTCTKTAAATAGQHANTGTATGTPPSGGNVSDSDLGHYFGAAPSIALVKLTNGTNNNSAPGPNVTIGSTVTWTYQVTNTGNVTLTNVVVRDDNGTAANTADDFTVCTIASLAAGASQNCTASRPAIAGQYENWATVTGNYNSTQVTAKDLDHYYGKGAWIVIKKVTKPTTGGSFNFTVTGSGYSNFTLAGGGTNTQVVQAGTFTVTEGVASGWTLTGIGGSTDVNTPYACVVSGSSASSGSGNLSTRTATITIANGDTVTCTFENTAAGATRTQGYWQTHPTMANVVWFGGSFGGKTYAGVAATAGIANRTICGKDLNTLGRVMGGFWASISKTSTGASRTSLDQARMRAVQQLIAAELNAAAFGTYPAGGAATFGAWETAICSTSESAVNGAQQAAGAFNESGDSIAFSPGTAADPKAAKAVADIVFWDKTKQ